MSRRNILIQFPVVQDNFDMIRWMQDIFNSKKANTVGMVVPVGNVQTVYVTVESDDFDTYDLALTPLGDELERLVTDGIASKFFAVLLPLADSSEKGPDARHDVWVSDNSETLEEATV